jgi:putative hydrolase of the HAD superfamily
MYKHIFWDLDHTLWDFDTNAQLTLQFLYTKYQLNNLGINNFDAMYKSYLIHNERLWDKYRKGQIKQQDLRWKRMNYVLIDFKIINETLAKALSVDFLNELPNRNALFAGSLEILEHLAKKNYAQHIITNGFEEVQWQKLKHSGLQPYFATVTTSEASFSLKPHQQIFEYALQKANATAEQSIMIGDNLEVDIEGAQTVNMDTVWVNHINAPSNQIKPTHIITQLKQLEKIL